MRIKTALRSVTAGLFVGMAALAACLDQGPDAEDFAALSQLMSRPVTQVDRFGIPAVNTAFIPTNLKEAFNRAAPADDPADFAAVIADRIVTAYGLSQASAEAIADFVTPDIQPLMTTAASGFPNGRRLADDVITTELMLIFGTNAALNDDHVDANDLPFLNTFPYLAPPHAP